MIDSTQATVPTDARPEELAVGISFTEELLTPNPGKRRALIELIADAGLDHLAVGDHISFHDGTGFDGLVTATGVLAMHDTLKVVLSIYLAGLRHPMGTARALATMSQIAPGRLVFGVGVGGEDRSEVANMGVDPATRGRRMDETLGLLRRLATGEEVDHDGRFFHLQKARILPPPNPRVPIVVGGSGDVAVRRTVAYADGWLGLWCSARRYAATEQQIREECAAVGRRPPTFHGFNLWVGLDNDATTARRMLGEKMSGLYNLPAEKFQHVTAAGPPVAVADYLMPYVVGGARTLTLVPVADSVEKSVELAAEVRHILQTRLSTSSPVRSTQ